MPPGAQSSPVSGGSPAQQQSVGQAPERIQQLKQDESVLGLAVNDEYIFAGTHQGEILVWSLESFQLVHRIQAHKRSVLCLFLSTPTPPESETSHSSSPPPTSPSSSSNTQSRPLLISSASDAIINVWCPRTLKRLYEIYSTHDVGDIFSVAYSAQNDTVYIGAQNTTIQWVDLSDPKARAPPEPAQHPDRRYHRFFDSKPLGGTVTPRRWEDQWSRIPQAQTMLEIDRYHIKQFAHYGYVYSMLMTRGPTVHVDAGEDVLISGGGEGMIKLWRLHRHNEASQAHNDSSESDITEIMTLGEDEGISVLSLAIDGSFLYSGKIHGIVDLWDLDTKQKLRVIKAHRGDVMTVQMQWGFLWSGSRAGTVTKHSTVHDGRHNSTASEPDTVSQKYKCLTRWTGHKGNILTSTATSYKGHKLFITGGSDSTVCVWRADDCVDAAADTVVQSEEDMMITSLRHFVSHKTISSRPEYSEDCRRGATFLCSLFKRLGAQVEMLSTADRVHNPVVFAKFSGHLEPAEKRKRILFYGHYDVVPADSNKGKWASDPFSLTGTNGYLYGRGVSDNKGPIMAALYAVTDLMQARQLKNDVVFLIEGEEESGSRSFMDTVRQHKELIGRVDYILLANSYWLDDETPCLTYGLRGVLHATVCVDSQHPDLHSGVDGSYMMAEPLSDLTLLLGRLKGPANRVMIPGFYDGILPLTPKEEQRFDAIASILMRRSPPENGPAETLKASLMARWREPNLTMHRYKVSGPEGSLVSSHASAHISLRLVPGQEVDAVAASLRSFLEAEFAGLGSNNSLSISIDNQAEPWLGDPNNEIFGALERAVVKVWDLDREEATPGLATTPSAALDDDTTPASVNGTRRVSSKPLYIREGGSIPAIRFLEKEFDAPAAHLPCGQASDAAHLDNERLRVLNLLKSREIFGDVFKSL